MKKAKVILSAICVIAIVGSVLAFKANAKNTAGFFPVCTTSQAVTTTDPAVIKNLQILCPDLILTSTINQPGVAVYTSQPVNGRCPGICTNWTFTTQE